MTEEIVVRGARLHNLQNITVAIPKNKLVVLSGVSGSGKSTLGFDILLREGQRQYIESLGMLPLGMAPPPVDSITGLAPTISVDQHLVNHSPRSTVGTATNVFTYLRLLYARLGHRPCPVCGRDVPPSPSPADADLDSDSEGDGAAVDEVTFPCPHCGSPIPALDMAHFSFNKPLGACPTCTGLGVVRQVDLTQLVEGDKSLPGGAVRDWNEALLNYHSSVLLAAASHYGMQLDLTRPVKDWDPVQRDLLFHGVESPQFRRHFPKIAPPATVRKGRFEGIATSTLRRYGEHIEDEDYLGKLDQVVLTQTCPDCGGTRLRPESRLVTLAGMSIIDASRLPLDALGSWLATLPPRLTPDENLLAGAVLADLQLRISRLVQVGAGYLTLERSSPTISTGEAERLRLASLLGSGLTGVLYVFDEPTVGLHQRDTRRLIEVLRGLRDLGNTVLVIEHDLEMIAAADHIIDFGPGGGKHGGQIVAVGSPSQIAAAQQSLTGAYLAGRGPASIPRPRRSASGKSITIRRAAEHNLQDLTVRLPLGLLIAVTGVSGSGKSTLVFDILDRALRQRLYGSNETPGKHQAIDGLEQVDKVITINQEAIGRMPRSNAATYADVFTPIREAFAATAEARRMHFSAGHFSFNVAGGRCERCSGAGVLTVQMHFLPDVEVRCPVCHGRRFTAETLAVTYEGRDISQVLDLTVDEALQLFADLPAAAARLQVLSDVGLGYIQLGQPASTLSGGEAQRVKLARELGRRAKGHTLYLLDEPTTGLHAADTVRLLGILQRLVDAGSTVIVVEHNLELICFADWIIDLGPEGGAGGGRLIAEGTPEQVAAVAASYTGQYLGEWLQEAHSHHV